MSSSNGFYFLMFNFNIFKEFSCSFFSFQGSVSPKLNLGNTADLTKGSQNQRQAAPQQSPGLQSLVVRGERLRFVMEKLGVNHRVFSNFLGISIKDLEAIFAGQGQLPNASFDKLIQVAYVRQEFLDAESEWMFKSPSIYSWKSKSLEELKEWDYAVVVKKPDRYDVQIDGFYQLVASRNASIDGVIPFVVLGNHHIDSQNGCLVDFMLAFKNGYMKYYKNDQSMLTHHTRYHFPRVYQVSAAEYDSIANGKYYSNDERIGYSAPDEFCDALKCAIFKRSNLDHWY